ncbi:TerB family tellurite resistance protein [Marinoscillum luteum]|uniref:TerB family tellurite resistance protein n=1 Tax=Marinoscillum luteum TaxID=861051 RepID=A0ABW7N861_9BACT
MDNFKSHLQSLIQLAVSDQNFNEEEKQLIYSIGKANKVEESEIDALIHENISRKGEVDISFSALSFEEKFQFLYNIIQLMKIDSKVFLSEIKYCEDLAQRLGFDKKVVKKLSSQIYSNPSITGNRDKLIKEARKFEL